MENKRVILAVALSLAVLVGWNFLFPPAKQAPKTETEVGQKAASTAVAASSAAAPIKTAASTPTAASARRFWTRPATLVCATGRAANWLRA